MVTRKKPLEAFGRQRSALEATIAALPTGVEHAAHVETCRGLADLLDSLPLAAFDDKLWREYRLALRALFDGATGGPDDDDFDAEFDALRAQMGDSAKPRTSHRRS